MIYDHSMPLEYLDEEAKQRFKGGFGFKSALATALGCNNAFVSAVFKGRHQFSLEQADQISEYLGHNSVERRYFYCMILADRATRPSLKTFYEKEMEAIRRSQRSSTIQKKRKTLTQEQRMTFYGSWVYGAIHSAVGVVSPRNPQALSKALGLPLPVIQKCVKFMLESGILYQKGNQLEVGIMHIGITREDPFISQHHTNWRSRAIQAFEQHHPQEQHYSGTAAVTLETLEKIKNKFSQTMGEVSELMQKDQGKSECVVAIGVDCYRVTQS